jgi:predicted TIM-barrel fold metal-dependent hydrolase
MAAESETGKYGAFRGCPGIIGHAECLLGDGVDVTLEAHIEAGGGRFKGIRDSATYDAGIAPTAPPGAPEGLYRDTTFQRGVSRLEKFGLTFEAWLYHPQHGDLLDLLKHCTSQKIVLNHLGGPLGVGPYEGKRKDVFAQWATSIRALAKAPNLFIKLGGLGMNVNGFGYHHQPLPPGSGEMAKDWGPYMETAIEAFGAERCMFESNFPVQKRWCSYAVVWNAFKRIAAGASAAEKAALFAGTAARVYRVT